jgi:hypothetical protein
VCQISTTPTSFNSSANATWIANSAYQPKWWTCLITFNANWWSTPSFASIEVTQNTPIWPLPTTTQNGYGFAWWYTLASWWTQIRTESVIASSTTYYAQWGTPYTVTFNWNWWTGHSPTTIIVAANKEIWTLPIAPLKVGYWFNGWWTNSNSWINITTKTIIIWNNTNYYAHWITSWSYISSDTIWQFSCYNWTCNSTATNNWVVYDTVTGLYWQSGYSSTWMSQSTGKSRCASLVLWWFNDWRLPDSTELASIINYNMSYPSIDTTYFASAANYYWSSTSYKDASLQAWMIDFRTGTYIYNASTSALYIRCVR